MQSYFNGHNHTMYSNLRLLDCINRPADLVNKARELGLTGIAITDHECLSAHMEVNKMAKELREVDPNFTIALGNEIYLTDDRERGQKYYHFILIAKDELGYKALKELSSIAWLNLYVDRNMERVPTLKSELKEIVNKYKGHLIATSACIGGELSQEALRMMEAQEVGDMSAAQIHYQKIIDFITFMKELFNDDFYIECAPSTKEEQIKVNRKLKGIAEYFNIKMTVATDAHYLTKDERPVHKAYLNSKNGEREVDDFYEFTYLMTPEECSDLLNESFGDREFIENIFKNTQEIQGKISYYSLEKKQIIPKVEVKDYAKPECEGDYLDKKYIILNGLLGSDNPQERYWVNECLDELSIKGLYNETYLDRLETEADIIKDIGEKLDDCLFAYFNTFKHYIDLFWECGSIVGPGRGSATGFLSNYLLGITQLDPVRWNLPYWRFLNKERVELPDIDIDLAPSKRPAIFEAIKKERGPLGLAQVAAFGTEAPKSSVLTACRGYRGENDEYPNGIDVDEAQYMSSLIPQERGFLWSIHDVVYGNPEKDRKPIKEFINEMNSYPGLLDIVVSIEGLVNKRTIHASGVILYGEDPFDTASFMRAKSGDIITSFELHDAESAGDTKYDFLVTEVSDKIIECYNLLKEYHEIEDISLRKWYNEFLHPEIIDTTNPEIWEHLAAGDVLDVFQFNTGVGLAIAKKLKPKTPNEMVAANAMMRLMSEKGQESQQDRFYRIQHQGIESFEQEMRAHNLSDKMREAMHRHCDEYYGCCPLQEQMMEALMDMANFTLGEANSARKIVAKKKMDQIPALREKVYQNFTIQQDVDYFWENIVAPQLGYAFSKNHSLPYSFVGIQTILLATKFNPIYWNTACLIVNSGSLEDNSEEEVVDIFEPEYDDLLNGVTFEDFPDKKEKIRKTSSTDYGKIAKAIGEIKSAGITVSLVDINKSGFGFTPDVENNEIIFGMKALLNVGDSTVEKIIENRPYTSPKDFLNKVKPEKQSMISLIKAGAFDKMLDRKTCMGWFIWETCDKKKKITLQNMGALIKYNLLPTDDDSALALRVYEFNRYLKAVCKKNATTYQLDERAMNFLIEIGCEELSDGSGIMKASEWDKDVYQKYMDTFRTWIAANKEEILQTLNSKIFKDDWDKYASGNLSSWEMEVLCFYYHEHELAHVNQSKYGFKNFFELPAEPEIEKSFYRGKQLINLFKLSRICGTCIAKNKTKSTVTLLTPDGVVNVKFRKEYFSLFDKQISERGSDGKKHVVEKSWFNRGEMILVTGMRRGDDFVAKKYASTGGHQLYRIQSVLENGDILLQTERKQGTD